MSDCVGCTAFPCTGVKHECYVVPGVDLKPRAVSIVMISEAAPDKSEDYFYARGNPLFAQTTVQAFRDAGGDVSSIRDLLALGVYFTTAVKCGKTGYGIETAAIKECSRILEKELTLFPAVKALMLMGDTAIKALNAIAQRAGEKRPVPAGSTYKIRNQQHFWRGIRMFPSYLQAGPSFFIEKSKRRMIAEDIRAALKLI